MTLHKNFIDKPIEIDYNQYTDFEEIIREMISYNKLLDQYRDTSFFDVFPQYRKYESVNA
jgi:hypothetical protein